MRPSSTPSTPPTFFGSTAVTGTGCPTFGPRTRAGAGPTLIKCGASRVTRVTCHTCHMSHVIRMSHVSLTLLLAGAALGATPCRRYNAGGRFRQTQKSHVTRHTSHVTRHMSHVTRYTPHPSHPPLPSLSHRWVHLTVPNAATCAPSPTTTASSSLVDFLAGKRRQCSTWRACMPTLCSSR